MGFKFVAPGSEIELDVGEVSKTDAFIGIKATCKQPDTRAVKDIREFITQLSDTKDPTKRLMGLIPRVVKSIELEDGQVLDLTDEKVWGGLGPLIDSLGLVLFSFVNIPTETVKN